MAYIKIKQFRDITGVDVATMGDAQVGAFLGASTAALESLTNSKWGHVIEGFVQNGADVDITTYGHMFTLNGNLMVSGTGNPAIDGLREYKVVDSNTIRLVGVSLNGTEVSGKIHEEHERDIEVMDARVRMIPCPVYHVSEVRLEQKFPDDASDAFGVNTILPTTEWYVPADGDWNSEVEMLPARIVKPVRRMRGFINPQKRRQRRVARVTYYVGVDHDLPWDLAAAIAAMAVKVAADPSGEFQSESVDYYSYSRMSISDMKDYPGSILSTFLRYKITN